MCQSTNQMSQWQHYLENHPITTQLMGKTHQLYLSPDKKFLCNQGGNAQVCVPIENIIHHQHLVCNPHVTYHHDKNPLQVCVHGTTQKEAFDACQLLTSQIQTTIKTPVQPTNQPTNLPGRTMPQHDSTVSVDVDNPRSPYYNPAASDEASRPFN